MTATPDEQQIAKLVLRHRDEPSPKLPTDWALLRLLDRQHCRQLEEDLRSAAPGGWEKHMATDTLYEMLADEPGLYMFIWRPWLSFDFEPPAISADMIQILYVGLAGAARFPNDQNSHTLRRRYKHYRKFLKSDPKHLWSKSEPSGRDQTLSRYFALRPLEYWCAVIQDAELLESLETRLITTLNPPCNIQDKPILMTWAGPTGLAFR